MNQIVVQEDVLSVLENHASTQSKMVRIVALMILFVKNLKTKIKQENIIMSDEGTRFSLVKLVHQEHFKEEYKWLKSMDGKHSDSRRLNKNCVISQLDLFIGESDMILIGRRLQNFHVSDIANI